METTPRTATRASLPLSRRLLYSALPALLLLALLELAARLFAPPADALIHREHENMIEVLGLSALNRTMEFDPDLFWRLKDGLDAFPVRGEIRGRPIDFRVSTRDGMRAVPGAGAGPPRVLALGDSCTFGIGVEDAESWPAYLQQELARGGSGARVLNAGVPGYSAYQGLRLLETRGDELAPDVVIASFGFNDRDLWSSRSDLETAEDLGRSTWQRALEWSRLYALLRHWPAPGPAREPDAPAEARRPGRRVPRLSPQEFRDTLRSIERRSAELVARLVFVAWPYRSQVDQGIGEFVRYQALMAAVAAQDGVPIVNLAVAFIADGRPLFVDHVHANADGNAVAARAIAPYALP